MKCPYCGAENDRVIETRVIENSSVIRRRRQCFSCLKRFTTYERLETVPLMVVKRDGRREPFNRDKVRQGIMRACVKRPISSDEIDKMIGEIEKELENYIMEVPSKIIGDLVLRKLRNIDEVAYVRFASIYKKFDNIESFMKELRNLKRRKGNNRGN